MNSWLMRIALFVLFLFPITIGQYSVNYLFAVFAVFMVLRARRLHSPGTPLIIAMAVYVLIYVVSLALDVIYGTDQAFRRTVSFAIFMTIFAFSVVDLDDSDVSAFKVALISICFVLSLQSLVTFFLVGGNGYGFGLKNVVGSQRYGFVYLISLFTLIHLPHYNRWGAVAKVIAGFVITAGLLLTFSRSSIIAFGAILPLYLVAPLLFKSGRSRGGLHIVLRRAGVGLAYAVALFVVMPVTYQFYDELILGRYTTAVEHALAADEQDGVAIAPLAPQADVLLPEGSEGTRLSIWTAVISHTLDHPLLGSGFMGSWTLETVVTGSAHNQYIDVLMRTGLPGLAIYLLILARLFFFLWHRDQGLFWGGLAILVYGLFHETFKESQGAFILAFLIGMYATSRRERRPAVASETALS